METFYVLPRVVSEPGSGSKTIPHATTYYLASSPGPSLPGRMARQGRAWGRGYIQPSLVPRLLCGPGDEATYNHALVLAEEGPGDEARYNHALVKQRPSSHA